MGAIEWQFHLGQTPATHFLDWKMVLGNVGDFVPFHLAVSIGILGLGHLCIGIRVSPIAKKNHTGPSAS